MGTLANQRFAVITGASSGIGLELARQCVENGFEVMICAEGEGITRAAADLATKGAWVEPVRADLATYEGVEHLAAAIEGVGRPVDALLLNAGVGVGGPFLETSLAEELRDELKDTWLTVTAVQPGPTETRFFERANMQDTRVGRDKKDDPAEVAREGFEAMMAGRDSVIAGSLKSKMKGYANEVLPETVKAKVQAMETKPGWGRRH